MDEGLSRGQVKAAVSARTGWTPSDALMKRVGRDGRAARPSAPVAPARRWIRPADVVDTLVRLHLGRAGRQKRRLDDERYWQAWATGGLRGTELRETLRSLTRVEPGSPVRRLVASTEHDCEAIRSFVEVQADKARLSHHPLIGFVRRNLRPLQAIEPTALADIMAAVVAPFFGEVHPPTWNGKSPNFTDFWRTGLALAQEPLAGGVSFLSLEVFKDGLEAMYKVGPWPRLHERLDELSDDRLEAADRMLRAWMRCIPATVEAHALNASN